MLAYLIIFAVFGYLFHRERNAIHGSVALMATITILVGATGYATTGIYLFQDLLMSQPLYEPLLMGVWLGLGYGTYRVVRHVKQKRFSRRYSLEALEEQDE